jgi:two-component system cell cycle response regulator
MGRVLIVDDNEDNLLLFQEYLEDNGFETALATSGAEALGFLEENAVDVIVLDIQMPEMDGFEVCRRVKNNEATRDIPVIFVTAKFQDVDHVATGLYLGANDYLYKPVAEKELVARVSVMVRLKAADDEVRRISVTDELTGLYNRRFLRRRLDEELSRARRGQLPLAVVLLDLDHFKKVNDTYGHAIGDKALCAVAGVLEQSLRHGDIYGRWGGEEFLVFLPGNDREGAEITAERLRSAISALSLESLHAGLQLTASLGVSIFDGHDPASDQDALVARADKALYAAKAQGRDRVCLEPLRPAPSDPGSDDE